MIPWKQNCPHIDDGWCVACVSRLGDAIEEYRDNDGSRGRYDVLAMFLAKYKLDAAMASLDVSNNQINDPQETP